MISSSRAHGTHMVFVACVGKYTSRGFLIWAPDSPSLSNPFKFYIKGNYPVFWTKHASIHRFWPTYTNILVIARLIKFIIYVEIFSLRVHTPKCQNWDEMLSGLLEYSEYQHIKPFSLCLFDHPSALIHVNNPSLFHYRVGLGLIACQPQLSRLRMASKLLTAPFVLQLIDYLWAIV